jgi:hypothetical protein
MHVFKIFVTTLLMLTSLMAKSTVIETTYGSFPGGFGFVSGGTSADVGTRTWALNPLDASLFNTSWFAFDPILAGMDGSGSELNVLSGLGTNTAVWTGTDKWVRFDGTFDIETRFTAIITSGQSWIDPASVGIIGIDIPALVSEIGSMFEVSFNFEARTRDGAWMAHRSLYNSVNNCGPSCSGQSIASASTKYFYTESNAVPTPGTQLLLAVGIVLLSLLQLRKVHTI